MNNLLLGQYIPKKSFLHGLDPRTKLICTFVLTVALILVKTLYGYIFAAALVFFIMKLSKIPIVKLLSSIKNFSKILIFTSLFHVFFTTGGSLFFEWGLIRIYDVGLEYAAKMLVRVVLLLFLTSTLTLTTKPFDIAYGLETILTPLKRMRLPVQQFSLMISITLRFIPTILAETMNVKMAQQSRGAIFNTKNIVKSVLSYIPIIIPMLILTIQRCENLTLAIDARAYNCGIERTNFRELIYSINDYCSFILVGITMVLFFFI